MKNNIPTLYKNLILGLFVILIGISIWYLESKKTSLGISNGPVALAVPTPTPDNKPIPKTPDYTELAKKYSQAPELVHPDGYINTGTDAQGNALPITIGQFIGKKVILVDFWTYSCINCQRTIPYLNAWQKKYGDQGLEIIGVQAPEFDFEKNSSNVQSAVTKFGIKYPVLLDNELATWNAYHNEYWPAEYLIDINGLVVAKEIGEGNYDQKEQEIQKLLQQRNQVLGITASVPTGLVTTTANDVETGSPETYFGSDRNEYLANGIQQLPGSQTLTLPNNYSPNSLYLGGMWNFQHQYAETSSKNATIVYQYNAKNVYFVASSKSNVSITVTRDGKSLGTFAGSDLDTNGNGSIKESRLYNLIQNDDPSTTHTLEITVHDPGLDAYTFTFG